MVGSDGYVGSTIAAYRPGGRSVGGLVRVATMYLILLFRTIHLVLYLIRSGVNGRTTSLIVGCIFGVLGTIFVFLSLAPLGSARGTRRVIGVNWARLHFDIVLGIAAVASLALMIIAFITTGWTNNSGLLTAWCVVWVFISLFAWIAQKPPINDTYL